MRPDTLKRTQDEVNKPKKSLHSPYTGWILYELDNLKLKKKLVDYSSEFHMYLSGQGKGRDQPRGPHLLPLFYRGLYFSRAEGKEATNKETVRLSLLMAVPPLPSPKRGLAPELYK